MSLSRRQDVRSEEVEIHVPRGCEVDEPSLPVIGSGLSLDSEHSLDALAGCGHAIAIHEDAMQTLVAKVTHHPKV